jgi:hypothetical protein
LYTIRQFSLAWQTQHRRENGTENPENDVCRMKVPQKRWDDTRCFLGGLAILSLRNDVEPARENLGI